MEERLEAAVSGSFKFKPEIDELIDEFADHNVVVLEPQKGWLYIPSGRHEYQNFRPLPNERGLTPYSVEGLFLAAIRKADFLYVNNPEGYIGKMVGFEMGYAHGLRKPIYIKYPLELRNFEYDLDQFEYWKSVVFHASPEEAVKHYRELRAKWKTFSSVAHFAVEGS